MQSVILGFTKQGNPVSLDFTHNGPSRSTMITGTSGSGKSVLIRAIISRGIEKGLKFIILETKNDTHGDFLPYYSKIDPYILQSSDPDTIANLIGANRNDLSILIDVCREGDTWEQIREKLRREMNNTKRHPLERKDAKMVEHYLGKILDEMKSLKDIRFDLQLKPQVAVMDLRGLSEEMQRLIASSTASWILNFETNTILIVDEYHKQGHNKRLEDYAAEGRSKGNFLIACDQNVTKILPDMRNNFQVWIFGRANDINKAKRVADQTIGLSLKPKDAMQLKTGEFLVNDYNEGTTERIFAWGDWYSQEEARKFAIGEIRLKDLPKASEILLEEPRIDMRASVLMAEIPQEIRDDWEDVYNEAEKVLKKYV